MKSGTCVKCGCKEIIRCQPGEYGEQDIEMPMTLTAEPRWVRSGRNPNHGVGRLITLTCRSCGYTEWYVLNPEDVPIDGGHKTSLYRAGQDDPPPEPFDDWQAGGSEEAL